jgi:phosphoserine phosphatase
MKLVATLITDPDRKDLTERKIGTVLDALKATGWSATPAAWLKKNIACDIFFHGPTLDEARALVRREFSKAGFDLVVQPCENRRRKLLLADMDSTIVVGETLDELADQAGIKIQVAEITARAMRGEIDFKGALHERVHMLKDLPVDRLDQTLAGIILTPGARTLVQTMRAHGAFTVLVSGGFRFFTRHVATIAGFHEDQANDLIIENDRLTGRVAEPILDKEAKLALLNRYVVERQIPMSASLTTGDGANDLPMLQAAGLGVAYHAKPVVEGDAPAAIRNGDLTALLYLQGYKYSEFKS